MDPIRNTPRLQTRILVAALALATVVVLAGVVGPRQVSDDEAGLAALALADMERIATGLQRYRNDTLTLPTGHQGRTDVACLVGPGRMPAGNPFGLGGSTLALEDALLRDELGGPSWRGPYCSDLQPDPWGQAYLVNVDGLIDARESAMVLCAGPDGRVQTSADARRALGDDLLVPLR